MCILFVYTDPNPPKGCYRLIIASNRDEYYKRAATSAVKCKETDIIGGRDVEPGREGGMWLGLSIKQQKIKIGALLNVTGENKKDSSAGRGPLVFNYLKCEKSAPDYIKSLKIDNYNAFNLVMTEIIKNEAVTYLQSNAPDAVYKYQGKQILGFGNSTPDVPFTKVKNGRDKFERIIAESQDRNVLVEKLIDLLKREDLHLPDDELQRRAPAAVNFLSAIFVKIKDVGYGTRTHSVILVDSDYNIEFIEHTMKEPINSDKPEWNITVIKSHL